MAARRIAKTPFQHFRRQRNWLLGLTLLGLTFVITLGGYSLFIRPDLEQLQTLLFFLLVGYLVWVLFAKQSMVSINMYYHFHRMIKENCPPIDVVISPQTSAFQAQLEQHGYQLVVDRAFYRIHYQVFQHLPFVKRTTTTMVSIIQLKEEVSFYDERIEEDLMLITSQGNNTRKIMNDIRLVFKAYDQFNQSVQEDYQKIINLSLQNRALITLPVGYNQSAKQIYVLRPIKQFPNKFYYAAIQLIYQLTKVQA